MLVHLAIWFGCGYFGWWYRGRTQPAPQTLIMDPEAQMILDHLRAKREADKKADLEATRKKLFADLVTPPQG